MLTTQCTIVNAKGMHARAAAEVVKLAECYQSNITIKYQGKQVSADNLLNLLTLAANCGKTVEITAEGADEKQAIVALESLFHQGFYES
ncbi:HPr family phosphocarrier protein [Pleionea mediterranea]|uniref:Phosphocarrier protein HPr n=1 Tax=Pleionea mediterranea TaxID=523701 RepID=A0A316FHR4_9GAMM|nr:HPr family phosphocarrier protein [Pleionea mediterranea]PWK47803.1 phosphocarrier protein [Pleionea mediterranea]